MLITNHEIPNPNPNTATIAKTINRIKSQWVSFGVVFTPGLTSLTLPPVDFASLWSSMSS